MAWTSTHAQGAEKVLGGPDPLLKIKPNIRLSFKFISSLKSFRGRTENFLEISIHVCACVCVCTHSGVVLNKILTVKYS